LLAYIHLAKGSAEQAKTELRAAIDAEPRFVSNYLVLEAQLEKEGKWDEARKVAEKAHDIDPESPVVANQLAYLYLEHGDDVNVALSLAQLAKQKLPSSPNVADTLGWAYYKLGMADPAIAQFKQCSQAAPNNPTYLYHLGMAYLAARDYRSAEHSLQLALKDPAFQYPAQARAALSKIPQTAHR